MPADLRVLAQRHGMPQNFADLVEVSVAARFRIAHREALPEGGLQAARHARRLDRLYQDSELLGRCGRWQG